jgi:hypothetical protein
MPEKLIWVFNAHVPGGPAVTGTGDWEVEAYDKVGVLIKAGTTDVAANVQPPGDHAIRLLVIAADTYEKGLTYKVNDTGETITLDAPHIFLGSGAVALLGQEPVKFNFHVPAAIDKDVTVQILVARMATVQPNP